MRSSSVPRNDYIPYEHQTIPYPNDHQSLNGSRIMHNRAVSKDFAYNNVAANAGKEILRSNINSIDMTAPPSRPGSQSKIAADIGTYQSLMQTASDTKLSAPGSWKDYISQQTQIAQSISQNEKAEQKLRALKYKETLDLMMQDERKRKMESKNELRSQPKMDDSTYYQLMHMEKMKHEEEKRKYMEHLEKQRKEKEEMKLREDFHRIQELKENHQRISKFKEFEQQQIEHDKMSKKQIFDEYKHHMEQRHQAQVAYQKARLEDKEGHYFLNDNEREKLFEKIRSKGFPNMDQFNHLKQIEYERKMKYDDFLNKQAQQREGREVAEAMRREEMLRKLKVDALSTNQQQITEKALISKRKREEEEVQQKVYQDNKKFLENVEAYERELMVKQKKDYLDALKTQAHAQQQSRYNANELTSIEKAINFRRQDPFNSPTDAGMTSLPFVGKSYERTKQLKYLDNWLNFAPK